MNANFIFSSVSVLRSWCCCCCCCCCYVFRNGNPVMFNSAYTVKPFNNISPAEQSSFLSVSFGDLFVCSELQGRSHTRTNSSARAHTHAHTGLCGSWFDAGLINDLITVEALNRARGKARIPDEEWKQSWTVCSHNVQGFPPPAVTHHLSLSPLSESASPLPPPSLPLYALISVSDQRSRTPVALC